MYRREIDGLRALAIVSVIAHHFKQGLLQSGHLGVDIFFVISGYVITAALFRRQGLPLRDFLLDFYARRVKRLVPALILCVLVTGLAIALVNPEPRYSLETGISSLLGLSNLYLLGQASDYFASPAQLNVFTQTWSLGVEEQFYFVFPLLLWTLGLRARVPHTPAALLAAVLGLTLASAAAFLIVSQDHASTAFYMMPTRFWELGVGALVFLTLGDKRPNFPATKGVATVSLLVLVATLFIPIEFAIFSTIAVVVATALVISAVRPGTRAFSVLSHPVAVYVGRISYSLYLWHWSVISISRWTVGVDATTAGFQVTVIVALSIASYRFVEKPLREARWAFSSAKTIGLGVTALVISAFALSKPIDGRLYSGDTLEIIASGTGSLTKEYPAPDGSSIWQGAQCVISGDADIGKFISIENCTLGNPATADRRILVLGDSFSAAFVPAFDDLVASHRYAVTIASSWGASAAPGISNNGSWSKSNRYYWNKVAPALVSQLKQGDLVFLVSDLAGYSPPDTSASSARELMLLQRALEAYSDLLARQGISLAILHGNPPAREAGCGPSVAIPQWFRPGVPCSFSSRQDAVRRRSGLDSLLAGLQRRGKLTIVDLIDVFCPRERCTYQARDGSPLYRDAHSHPSVEAVQLSEIRIRDAIMESETASR